MIYPIVLSFCLLFLSPVARGQDTVPPKAWWVPHHLKVQFAGGIGLVAAGAGYANRKGKLEGDLFYGYVPRSVGGTALHSATAKIGWWPLKPVPLGGWRLKPLGAGLLVNYTFGKQFFSFSPRNYPYSYYDHPTALHGGLFAGSAITRHSRKGGRVKGWGLYYEVVTYDVELISYLGNRGSLSVKDILSLGFGLRADF